MHETPDFAARIENSIDRSLTLTNTACAPQRLTAAVRYAVKPGGARIRPTILLSVSAACGDDHPELSDAAAAALELIHCASLVHDDLPCFDDAALRRGKPSVHQAYSEPLAVLTGDSLIMLAFETIARAADIDTLRSVRLIHLLARKSGTPDGICAGQGWESENQIDLTAYHQSKTGSLFVAATQMGAIAAGHDPQPWFELGDRIGEAFQVADDLRDALMETDKTGKPSGQDARLGRPNAVTELGAGGAMQRLKQILDAARASVPACPGKDLLEQMIAKEMSRVMPEIPASKKSTM